MRKISVTALVVTAALVLMGASECDLSNPAPDKPGGTADTTADCLVYGRQTNSKGQHYLEVKCSLPGGGLSESAELLPNNDPNAWPACGNGKNWPACREA